MDNIDGIPEGYRLGKDVHIDWKGLTPLRITFEILPIEQPPAGMFCEYCGQKWPDSSHFDAEFSCHKRQQPKQLEAVIVVDAGPSITAQQDEYKKMLIAQDITEAGYTVRSVTIRERGAIEQGTTPGIAALSSEKQLKSMVNKGCLGCLTDDCDHWNDDTCKEFSGCKLERTICEREKGKNEA